MAKTDRVPTEDELRLWQTYWEETAATGIPMAPQTPPPIPGRRLDLHGLTMQEAYGRTMELLEQHHQLGTKDMVIITGKSGQIRDEFIGWLGNCKHVARWEPLQDRRGGIGSYRVFLRQAAKSRTM